MVNLTTEVPEMALPIALLVHDSVTTGCLGSLTEQTSDCLPPILDAVIHVNIVHKYGHPLTGTKGAHLLPVFWL